MVSKKFMRTQYSPEWKQAMDEGYTYAHDASQELFKGINCFTLDPREVIRKGLRTYGDNNVGVTSAPPKHFATALELIEQTMGLAVVYCAGGIAAASLNTFLAPFMVGESDKDIKQALQSLLFQMNQSFKNRGCVAGDTEIWVKLDGNVKLMTFKEVSDLLGADYGSTDLTNVDLKILTLTDKIEVKWVKPTLFWRNEPRDLYEVVLPKGRSFKCDEYHGLISANNVNNVRNILDIKKGTQLCDPKGINFFTDVEQDTDYWNGVLYGFWLGDGYKNTKRKNTTITVGKKDKIDFLDLLFSKLDIDVNRTVTKKKVDWKHKIPEYVNYFFSYDCLVSEDGNLENKNYLAGLITGMLNSDGSVRIGTSGILEVSFQNTNEWYVDLLRYALFYFGIRCNKNVKSRKNPKPNWSPIYRLNMEYNKNSEYLYKQLELRPLFKDALNKSLPVKFYGTTNRMLIKSITPLNEKAETYCFTANGRMIIGSGFILTNNSQSMFSSVNMDLEMPEWLKNETAYGRGGEPCGVYGDYQDEAKRFVHLLTEVSIEGDAEDKPLFMPNLIYNIDGADLNEWLDVFELSAKFSSPYFCHYKANNVEYQSTLGCFSPDMSLWVKIDGELKYLSFKEIDELLNANIGVTTVNNIEVLTINDDKKIVWDKAKNFIKNKPMDLFEVKLTGNRSFICDENHTMISPAMNKRSIFDCKNHLKSVGIHRDKIEPDKRSALYGFYCGDGKKGNDFKRGFANLMLLKPDKIEYARDLLTSLNVDFKEKIIHHTRDNNDYTVFYFSANEIQEPDLLEPNNCAGLLEGMLSSDGYVRLNTGGFDRTSLSAEFVSTDLKISRLFKFACFNLGIKFSSRLIQPSKNQKNRVPFERVYLSCNYESVNILKQLSMRYNQQKIVDDVNNDFRHINEVVSDKIKEITPLNESDYTYCFEVNDRIIVGSDFILTGQCRSALPANWTGDPNIDCMGLGNSVYTTVSLPAIALKTVEEDSDFYKELDYYMELVREYNKNRLDWIKKLWFEYHTADFMIQEMPSGRPLYDLDNATIVCGYLGLSEALEILGYGDITVANSKAREIMTYMGDKIAGWKNEDNLRYGLFQTPAENLAYKNAQKMVKKYGFKKSHAKGTATRPYYTNSNHVPVDSDINLIDRIRIEGNNQPLGAAGNIMNVYLGESYSEASALKSLCEKIRDNTDAYFWAFTGDYAICPECNSKFKGNIEKCPFDSAETDVYSRVTGYMTNTKTWNRGKQEEMVRRHRY